jgi:hypothetical protein
VASVQPRANALEAVRGELLWSLTPESIFSVEDQATRKLVDDFAQPLIKQGKPLKQSVVSHKLES